MSDLLQQLNPDSEVPEILKVLRDLDDAKARAVNERHGNDYGVNLSQLRNLAKQIKPDHERGLELWAVPDTAAQLLAILTFKPRLFGPKDMTDLMRTARAPKAREWAINYIAKKSKYLPELRDEWRHQEDPELRAAGWELMAYSVSKVDPSVSALQVLEILEEEMASAPETVQWGMNNTLAQIGISHEDLRQRAMLLGERVGAFKDYPTSPGCVSPYAPTWIAEMVSRAARGK